MKTLDNILKTFNKTLKQLDDLQRANETKMADNYQDISILEQQNEALDAEYRKAETIAVRIRELIGA